MPTTPPASASPIIVMGVSGCGKSLIGSKLAEKLHYQFIDGDKLHPAASIQKMRANTPLTDEDRWPWLKIIASSISEHTGTPGNLVVACSALRKTYRDYLIEQTGQKIQFIHLRGSKQLIAQRLADRRNHFMSAAMIDSQFATLETPNETENVVTIDIDRPVEEILTEALLALK